MNSIPHAKVIPLEERVYPSDQPMTEKQRAHKAVMKVIRVICEGKYRAYVSECEKKNRKPKSQPYHNDPYVGALLTLQDQLLNDEITPEMMFSTLLHNPDLQIEMGRVKGASNPTQWSEE